tara:strand:+ start:4789 stop:4902 length:114 start_codon:yes stop_codon:yes gene_type:complete
MKFLPSMDQLVKGIIVTVLTLVILRFVPAEIKAKILG